MNYELYSMTDKVWVMMWVLLVKTPHISKTTLWFKQLSAIIWYNNR